MTAAETRLDQALQICQLQANELEVKDNQLRQVQDTLDNIMQDIDDKRIKSDDLQKSVLLHNQWKGLNQFKKELEKILGEG